VLPTDRLLQSIQFLKGVGPQRKKRLKSLGIEIIFDLLWLIPRRYIACGLSTSHLQKLNDGGIASVIGVVQDVHCRKSKNGMVICTAMVKDNTLILPAIWFNQPYISNLISPGMEIMIVGRLKEGYRGLELHVIEYELLPNSSLKHGYLPVYPLVEGINQKFIRKLVRNVLDEYLRYYPEIIDQAQRERYQLCDIHFALENIHFPQDKEALRQANLRLAVEEIMLLLVNVLKNRLEQGLGFVQHKPANDVITGLISQLPFKLTRSQKRVLQEIFRDMESPRHMNRLVQGDVGSGKTVIAILALAKAVASGFQASLMAPTEILAEQHYKSVNGLLAKNNMRVACLTKSCSVKEKKDILDKVASGDIDILVGTHSVIQDKVVFKRLGLVVIDEQHRFGVRQRSLLESKGDNPDVMVMTATPIPRTLALTFYGELNVSTIDELPPGRKPVKTVWVKTSERSRLYNFIRKQLASGEQAYYVTPLIEETENQDIKDAVSLHNELTNHIFPGIEIGLIHGKMNARDKDRVMRQFKSGVIRILVATTVIEVGIDVPSASIMVVEQAERFGLSQLHQLRGRVGRGSKQAYCFLVCDPKTEEAHKRLRILQESHDGFRLAEEDLKIRGPGEMLGMKQHGLNQFKMANLISDPEVFKITQSLAGELDILRVFETFQPYINQKFPNNSFIAQN
jgi:ATP-dependent DNA helicase RecG